MKVKFLFVFMVMDLEVYSGANLQKTSDKKRIISYIYDLKTELTKFPFTGSPPIYSRIFLLYNERK